MNSFQGPVGKNLEQVASPGVPVYGFRFGNMNELTVSDGRGHFEELVRNKRVYTLTLPATTTNIAAGHLVAAAAAANVQFVLMNKAANSVNLVILRFACSVLSGTVPAGPIWYGMGTEAASPIANTLAANATMVNNFGGWQQAPQAGYYTHVSGAAHTGAGAVGIVGQSNISFTAGSAAALAGQAQGVDNIDGLYIVPPGYYFLPLWSGAGTTVLNSYSITWAEVPATM